MAYFLWSLYRYATFILFANYQLMKKTFIGLAIAVATFIPFLGSANDVWKEMSTNSAPKETQLIKPDVFKVFALDVATFKLHLAAAGNVPEQAQIITLPTPGGGTRDFRVWETSMMPDELANQFQDIKTYTATAVDDPRVGAKLDITMYGFHAMVFDGDDTYFIDPWDNYSTGTHLAYYKRDLNRAADKRMMCELHTDEDLVPNGSSAMNISKDLPKLASKVINGYSLRTYRLALSCSNQYARAATGLTSPTKAQVLAKMTTTMNRVNGVYEREFSITMKFVTNQTDLIFVTAAGDPFNSINSNPNSCLSTNRTQCNTIIGSSNYDIGHVFTTGSGGLASLGSVCTFAKAEGTTGAPSPTGDGFDIDYVAHEMGHQFGSDHTFNNNADGSCCCGNAVSSMSYEPGSGSTIMAYAGICSPDNVQTNSNPYFHIASIQKILTFVNSTGTCATFTATDNKSPGYTPLSQVAYSIPYLTPFELYAPMLTDSMADSATLYSWEQFDPGGSDFGRRWSATAASGPIFRSLNPVAQSLRIFPRQASVMAGNLNTLYEKAPTVARSMKFKCTFRSIRNNKGILTIPDETITINAVTTGTGAGFKVTSQASSTVSYTGGSTQTVTWDVANTNNAPVSTAQVDIYLTVNVNTGWTYYLGSFPNTGSATVTIPNPATTTSTARIKVKGKGNVFFNVNTTNFTVTNNAAIPSTPPNSVDAITYATDEVFVYPVPATNSLHISTASRVEGAIYNMVGQKVWAGNVSSEEVTLDVAGWAKGAYVLRLTDKKTGAQTVKQIVLQ